MTQSNPILGSGLSGLEYRDDDNDGKRALLNHHKGAAAPAYAEAGVLWLDDSATPWILKIYDGADWLSLFSANAGTNSVSPFLGSAALRLLNHAADTGSVNVYALAPVPAVSAYAAGQIVTLKPANANTGSSTLAVNGLTATSIKMPDGGNLLAGAMLATGTYLLFYDGTYFILLNPTLAAASSILWVTDKQSSGATPASATQGSWTTRILNTVGSNTIAGASHSSGVISLPAGTYSVRAALVMANVNTVSGTGYTCRLRDTTHGVTLIPGMPQTPYLNPSSNIVPCDGIFVLSSSANVELQYYANATGSPKLGRDSGAGDMQVWASVYLKKEV
jgi:hypothetical protein